MNCVHAAVMSHFSLGIPSIQSPESPTMEAYFEQYLCPAAVKHTWQQVLQRTDLIFFYWPSNALNLLHQIPPQKTLNSFILWLSRDIVQLWYDLMFNQLVNELWGSFNGGKHVCICFHWLKVNISMVQRLTECVRSDFVWNHWSENLGLHALWFWVTASLVPPAICGDFVFFSFYFLSDPSPIIGNPCH